MMPDIFAMIAELKRQRELREAALRAVQLHCQCLACRPPEQK